MKEGKRVHFMGIGGSAISGIALMSHLQGYVVSGCDLNLETDYLEKVKKVIKKVYHGHSKDHLKRMDFLVVSPSVFFVNKNHPEVIEAKKRKILLTWEVFLGKYLQKEKEVVCISGTHGKSTTTALTGLLFEKANFDPSVVIGAKVKEWEENFRLGKGEIFITEADEFFDNFLNYSANAIIINNIEFDHPDYFSSEEKVIESFRKFILRLKGKKILIVNQDSLGIKKLFSSLDKNFLKGLNLYGYTFSEKPPLKVEKSVKVEIIKKEKERTIFRVSSQDLNLDENFYLKILGDYNVANATGVIILAKLYGIENKIIQQTFGKFQGIVRRLMLMGERKNIRVYDDYAHHPTAIKETLSALRQRYPKERIWVIVEPHSYSRTKALLERYKGVFKKADEVIIGPIFKARDLKTYGISGKDIAEVVKPQKAIYLDEVEKIIKLVNKDVKIGDVIVVMGAGESYQWARKILSSL